MSVTYISADLRRLVQIRAYFHREYCLISEEDTIFGCAVDHIINEKHGGLTEPMNLAYACVFCNQAKGSDIGSFHWKSKNFVRFFKPRADRWNEHFNIVDEQILGISQIGEVTAKIFGFNRSGRILERMALISLNRFPSETALKIINQK